MYIRAFSVVLQSGLCKRFPALRTLQDKLFKTLLRWIRLVSTCYKDDSSFQNSFLGMLYLDEETELCAEGKDDLRENTWDCNSKHPVLVPNQPECREHSQNRSSVASSKPTQLVPQLHACRMPTALLLRHLQPTPGQHHYNHWRTNIYRSGETHSKISFQGLISCLIMVVFFFSF